MPAAILPPEFEAALARIEQQLDLVFEAIHNGDPAALESASNTLQQLGVAFSRMVEGRLELLSDAATKRRLKKIIKSMAIQRENLMRRTASVERSLDVLIPESRNAATYAKAVGPHGGMTTYKQVGVSRQYAI